MANPGYTDFNTKICIDDLNGTKLELFKRMAARVEDELRQGIEAHPEWFCLSPKGVYACEKNDASIPGEPTYGIEKPFDILPHRCRWLDALLGYPSDIAALVTERDDPDGWIVSTVTDPKGFARHSMLVSFHPNGGTKSTSLVRFAPDSPFPLVATAIEDLAKAYLFPEAIAMNDYSEMAEILAWGTSVYSMHEFDLCQGGIGSVSEQVKASLAGKGNTFAVLSFPMDGFRDEMVETVNQLADIIGREIPETELFCLSCSLNVLTGQTARLSLFARLLGEEDFPAVG